MISSGSSLYGLPIPLAILLKYLEIRNVSIGPSTVDADSLKSVNND